MLDWLRWVVSAMVTICANGIEKKIEELYLQGGQGKMSEKLTKKQRDAFSSIKDEDIDTSDIPELDANFWKNARIVKPQHKKAISLRIDEDVLSWFKEQGKGYQSLMNSVLRAYYHSHEGKNPH